MGAQNPLSMPDLHHARKLLCIQPHYDDNDIAAGGTIATLRAAGATIIYLTATDDLVGVVDPTLSDAAATARLRQEQAEAGALIGVSEHHWLGYPDAGEYDYFELRRQIISYIRLLRPDFLLTVDPWLPYEAHRDHRQVGLAVAEAACLQGLVRLRSDPQADRGYEPYRLAGVGFYFTHVPNTFVDITGYRERKYQALASYRSQLPPDVLKEMLLALDRKQREYGEGKGFAYAEALKVLRPGQLHCDVDAWRM